MEIIHLNGRHSSKVNRWIKRKNWTSGERSLQISVSSHFSQMKSGRGGRGRGGGGNGGVAELPSQWGDSLLIEISLL